MKLANIPPVGHHRCLDSSTGIQMAIAIPQLMDNHEYTDELDLRRRRGDLIMLDNGALEGQPIGPAALASYSFAIRANEICLPDILGDGQGTLDLVRDFVTRLGNTCPQNCRFLAIAQGKTLAMMKAMIGRYADIPQVNTIGIPRDTIDRAGERQARIDLANWIQEQFPDRFEIHFLGTHPKWVKEIYFASKYAPHVRSVDTSLAFNATIARIHLTAIATAQARQRSASIARPVGYFDVERGMDPVLLNVNLRTLREWAVGA